MRKSLLSAFFLSFVLIFVLSNPAYSAYLMVDELYFQDSYVYISLESSVTDEIDVYSFIEDGVEITAEYKIRLFRRQGFLTPDEEITNINVSFFARKDFINDGYEVKASIDDRNKVYWFHVIDDMYNRTIRVNDLRIIAISFLLNNYPEQSEYYIQAELSYVSLELYPPLSLIYNLLGNWNYHSKKVESRGFRVDGILLE